MLPNTKIKNSVIIWFFLITISLNFSAYAADILSFETKSEETLNDNSNDRGSTSVSTGTAVSAAPVNFSIQSISPDKVFTPAASANNTIEFIFNNPDNASVEGKIFDTRGAHVADMTAGTAPGSLLWDGKESGGSIVRGGVYIYQVEASGAAAAIITGTVVAAR